MTTWISAPGNILGVENQICTPPKHFLGHLSQKGYPNHSIFNPRSQNANLTCPFLRKKTATGPDKPNRIQRQLKLNPVATTMLSAMGS
jgi:hypothetical protein